MKKTHSFRRHNRHRAGGPLLINFMLGEDLYAIDMRWISRVELTMNLTRVPCVPQFVVGVTLLNGQVVTVVDLHEFLEVRGTQVTPKAQIILDIRGQLVSFLSDSIPGFIALENPIEPITDEEVSILIGVSRLGDAVVNLLDAEQLYFLLTGNIEKMQRRILKRVSDRVTEVLGDVAILAPARGLMPEAFNLDDHADCLTCDNLGFLVIRLDDLFSTMLTVLNELDMGASESYNTMDLSKVVAGCLTSIDPFRSLQEELEELLGKSNFQILIAYLDENHVVTCPDCGHPE
ncbi:MAG: chemotaxis protein CheW [Planctomycetota bacterium]|nr:chemotaxis protein CheW [Planctomycetota bacterium]